MIKNKYITITILNWNGIHDTIKCLESLNEISYPNYLIVVVDNRSKDNFLKQISQWVKGNNTWIQSVKAINPIENNVKPKTNILLVKNQVNAEFVGGSGFGFKPAKHYFNSEYPLFLNSHTVATRVFVRSYQ